MVLSLLDTPHRRLPLSQMKGRQENEKSGGRVASALSYMGRLSKSRCLCGFLFLTLTVPFPSYLQASAGHDKTALSRALDLVRISDGPIDKFFAATRAQNFIFRSPSFLV